MDFIHDIHIKICERDIPYPTCPFNFISPTKYVIFLFFFQIYLLKLSITSTKKIENWKSYHQFSFSSVMTYVGMVYRPIPNTIMASTMVSNITPTWHQMLKYSSYIIKQPYQISKKIVEYHSIVVLKKLIPTFMFIFPLVSILDHHLVYIQIFLQSLWKIWLSPKKKGVHNLIEHPGNTPILHRAQAAEVP